MQRAARNYTKDVLLVIWATEVFFYVGGVSFSAGDSSRQLTIIGFGFRMIARIIKAKVYFILRSGTNM